MKIHFLLIGTSLSLIPQTINAQCVATQDCATLGYTETSCSGGSGVKCPFGNFWACFKSESEVCEKYGFTNTCTGTEYSGGFGATCNGKYYECTCASGYEWDATNGVCKVYHPVCEIGTLYYSDNTCSANYDASKTLLGVVIYSNGASGGGWIMAINDISSPGDWGGYGTDIPRLVNITSESNLTDIQASCTNTDIITAKGNSSEYFMAWTAKLYKPTGTPSNKSWCLPSGGLLKTALNNSTNLTKVNAGITKAGGSKIKADIYGGYIYIWSSSEYDKNKAWAFYVSRNSTSMQTMARNVSNGLASVYPVMEF